MCTHKNDEEIIWDTLAVRIENRNTGSVHFTKTINYIINSLLLYNVGF